MTNGLVRIIEGDEIWLYGRVFANGPLVRFKRDLEAEFIANAIKKLRGVQ